MARIRKALIAAVGAAVPAGWAAFQKAAEDGAMDQEDVIGIVATVLVAAASVGWVTFRVPNALTPSDLAQQQLAGGHKPA